MTLQKTIESIQEDLKNKYFTTEPQVSQGIFLPIVNELGWPIFDPQIVFPEYTVKKRRVDFALCHPKTKPLIFAELKRPGNGKGADEQLFEYCYHAGIQTAIFTDGQLWSFYLPREDGDYDERIFYKFDMLAPDFNIKEVMRRVMRYFQYETVCSGEAIRNAREDYKSNDSLVIVVPAREDNFKKLFLGQNCWYSIYIGKDKLKDIKYIAAYQTAPISAITHYAKVASIEPYGDEGKYKLNFASPAKAIVPIGGVVPGFQSSRYTSYEKLMSAKELEDLFPKVDSPPS